MSAWRDRAGSVNASYAVPADPRLVGLVPDQAALQGILRRLSDFGIELVAVTPADAASHT